MRAVYLEAPKNVFIKSIEEPLCPMGYAKIKVKVVGICGSDVSAYKGTSPMCTYPRIIGHEIVGEIVEINTKDTKLKLGDRVILEPYVYCGRCYPCISGRTNSCENLKVLGVHIDGGMTEYISHPAYLIHKLPDNLSFEEAVMAEPLSIALHSIHRLRLKSEEYILIFGAGQIGNLVAQASLAIGAIPILVDVLDERLNIAGNLGIKYLLNPNKENVVKTVKEITNNRMAECVVEATGSSFGIRNSLDVVAYTGRIAFVGWTNQEISLPTALITRKELDIYGSRNSAGEFPLALEMIEKGKVNVSAIISEIISLDEVPRYLEILANEPSKFLKVLGKIE